MNTGEGPGVLGTSAGTDGVDGKTSSNGTSHKAASGIAGLDLTSSAYNFGVFGNSRNGQGVHGSSATGTGTFGATPSGIGVHGTALSGTGVLGESTSGTGGSGVTGKGNRGYGVTASSRTAALYASGRDTGAYVVGSSPASSAQSAEGTGLITVGGNTGAFICTQADPGSGVGAYIAGSGIGAEISSGRSAGGDIGLTASASATSDSQP